IRVTETPETRTTVVRSTDPTLLRTLEVDQSLTGLGLMHEDGELRTRTPREIVFWALSDARYPVVAEDGSGNAVRADRGRVFEAPDAADPYAGLIERLRAH